MYQRRYSGQLDYIPVENGFYEVETFILQDESIGFAMTEVVPRGDKGWVISGRATKQEQKYVASNLKFTNKGGASSADRTITFIVIEEEFGVFATIRGDIKGADILSGTFEGTLEAIK